MPISRNHVRRVCGGDAYDVYCASLRRRLSELNESELRHYVQRAQANAAAAGRASRKRAGRCAPGRVEFLSGALSRLEGRLRVLSGPASRAE